MTGLGGSAREPSLDAASSFCSGGSEPEMNEWDDEKLEAWIREELASDGVREEEVKHVLAVLRHNEIDSSVLVLLTAEDLKLVWLACCMCVSKVACCPY